MQIRSMETNMLMTTNVSRRIFILTIFFFLPCFSNNKLLQSLKWREELEVEKLRDWEPPEVFQKYYPCGISGFDKEGSPGMRTKPVSSNTIILITHHLKTLVLSHKIVTTLMESNSCKYHTHQVNPLKTMINLNYISRFTLYPAVNTL
jgi:hypothetical protein